MPGTMEIVIVCIVVILVFGSTKLPQLGDGLGRAIKNFKRAVSSNNEIDVSPKKASAELGGNERAAGAADVSASDKKTTAAK
ncbi:MAG TPA: twin-arginine translocase TatA/TatE family subunit [Polyangia bacterium]|nr:twin-arginine translocase TatA/TatE family subunit [Polyangia bacterium]